MAKATAGEIVYKVTGDASQLKREMAGVSSAVSATTQSLLKDSATMRESFQRITTSAKLLGDTSGGLAQKTELLKQKINSMVASGVNPANVRLQALSKMYQENTAKLQAMNSKTSETTSIFSKLGPIIAATFGVRAIIDFAKHIINSASAASETLQKFNVVYSKISETALKAAADLAAGWNLSKTGAQEMLASTGNVLESMGFSQKEALKYSLSLSQLGADLTSYTNYAGGSVEATRILTKAMLGEREALAALNFKISDEAMIAYAASLGKTWEKLGMAEKAELTMNKMLQMNKNATGDTARSVDTYAYQLRRAENNLSDLSVTMGNKYLPAATTGLKAFNALTSSTVPANLAIKSFQLSMLALAGPLLPLAHACSLVGTSLKDLSRAALSAETTSKLGKIFDDVKERVRQAAVEVGLFTGLLDTKVGTSTLNPFQQLQARLDSLKKKKKELDDDKAAPKPYVDPVLEAYQKRAEILQKNIAILEEASKRIDDNNAALLTAQLRSSNFGGALKTAFAMWERMDTQTQLNTMASGMSKVSSGVNDMFNALIQYQQAVTAAALSSLDEQMNAELEAAGVADDTAIEKAQKEYDAAVAAGDAATIEEKRKALAKAKIEDDYAKKKKKVEYEGQLAVWEMQRAMAVVSGISAVMNAIASGFVFGPLGAAAYGAMATVLAGVQLAAIDAAKPKAPKYAVGGIVPATSQGTNIIAGENNTPELIMNPTQALATLQAIGNGKGGGSGQPLTIYLIADGIKDMIYNGIYPASQDGKIKIDSKAWA
jgi:hypothetical protein